MDLIAVRAQMDAVPLSVHDFVVFNQCTVALDLDAVQAGREQLVVTDDGTVGVVSSLLEDQDPNRSGTFDGIEPHVILLGGQQQLHLRGGRDGGKERVSD